MDVVRETSEQPEEQIDGRQELYPHQKKKPEGVSLQQERGQMPHLKFSRWESATAEHETTQT